MNKAFWGLSILPIAFFSGCGDDSSSSPDTIAMPDGVVRTTADLGTCDRSNEGKSLQVIAEGAYFICSDGKWVDNGWWKDIQIPSSSSWYDEISSSAKSSSSMDDDEEESSSSIAIASSSSSEDEELSSSSEDEELSSSSEDEELSSSSEDEEELSSSSAEPDDI